MTQFIDVESIFLQQIVNMRADQKVMTVGLVAEKTRALRGRGGVFNQSIKLYIAPFKTTGPLKALEFQSHWVLP